MLPSSSFTWINSAASSHPLVIVLTTFIFHNATEAMHQKHKYREMKLFAKFLVSVSLPLGRNTNTLAWHKIPYGLNLLMEPLSFLLSPICLSSCRENLLSLILPINLEQSSSFLLCRSGNHTLPTHPSGFSFLIPFSLCKPGAPTMSKDSHSTNDIG